MFVDSSLLVGLGQGRDAAVSFYEANRLENVTTTTVVAYEVFAGLADRGASDALEPLRQDLDWVDFVVFTFEDAYEAARLEAELLEAGDRIPVPEVMIAAAARRRGERLVAADDHFERIDGLAYVDFRA